MLGLHLIAGNFSSSHLYQIHKLPLSYLDNRHSSPSALTTENQRYLLMPVHIHRSILAEVRYQSFYLFYA